MDPTRISRRFSLALGLACLATPSAAQEADDGAATLYRLPPQEVVDVVTAEPTPYVMVAPDGRTVVHAHHEALPSIEEVAQPFLRLAGLRIHPERYERRTTRYATRFELQDVETGAKRAVELPEGGRLGFPSWAPDARTCAFTRTLDDGVELWVADVESAKARRLVGPRVNDTHGDPFAWWSGSERLLVRLVPANHGAPPEEPRVPAGPIVSETAGRAAENRTYQDLLQGPHDERLFEHYLTVQLAEVDLEGSTRTIGTPAILGDVEPSPDGQYLLVERLKQPWSYTVPVYRFAHTAEVWSAQGDVVKTLADLPVADEVPIGGVPTGARSISWRDDRPATLVWAEALDEGDPDVEVPHRDRLVQLAAPFDGQPAELARTRHRFSGVDWTDLPGVAFVSEYDRDRRWTTTHLHRFDDQDAEPRVVWDRSVHDRYGDPGDPVRHTRPDGTRTVLVDPVEQVYLEGRGAGPEGERPFLDVMSLETLETERLFRSQADAYTSFVHFVGGRQAAPGEEVDGRDALLRRESPADPPNYFVWDGETGEVRQLTDFPDPHPQLTGITKELVTYEREDGVPLSGTLYLPPDHQPGQRLPLLVWAYPVEYTDSNVAGQVRTTTNRFTRLAGTSPLLFLTQGYAVLDDAAMPVVGDPETMNDTFVQQIVGAARAAIETLDARGVIDPDRVAVAGHSYGAFMTANLLAHSDLFRAGIARSGAYNRSLTPFGFQSERRTLWEGTDAYVRVSPFFHAHGIDEPILLIHGEVDSNSGTFPIQSKRLYHALEGLGGTAKLVLLPHESHGYSARESVLHVLAESIEWLDAHVKEAGPRPAEPAEASTPGAAGASGEGERER